MIGVLAKDSEVQAVREFFQLFKTPWEFCIPGNNYDLVIVTREEIQQDLNAHVLVIFHSRSMRFDEQIGVVTVSRKKSDWAEWGGVEFPIYGDLMVFGSIGRPLVRRRRTLETVGSIVEGSERVTVRLGFDLFYEVAFLLSKGQPAENARFTTLDTHISLLRTIMVSLGVPFIEVPPVPAGYEFMVCLTHDVDFIGIRDHKCDHTMWGFLYRSLVVSLLDAMRGKLPWSKCLQNWTAALSLPLVFLGFKDDFWLEFARYVEIERECGSTFFFIPFKNVAGTLGPAPAPKRRAAKYDLRGIKGQVAELLKSGCEVGLHGIDSWQNLQSAQLERSRIREVTGQSHMGARMHWLYWEESTPRTLEEAGFTYDSTFGYNDAIGFRAGATQPFCPLEVENLLELPLNIQDTAMFYSGRMKLSDAEALDACKELIHSMALSGGVLTVNWHTRSLSPERLWGDFYRKLLKEIQSHRVWFGTAQEIVDWFRKRRELRFDSVHFEDQGVRVALAGHHGHSGPDFLVRVYHPSLHSSTSGCPAAVPAHRDHQWSGQEEVLQIAN